MISAPSAPSRFCRAKRQSRAGALRREGGRHPWRSAPSTLAAPVVLPAMTSSRVSGPGPAAAGGPTVRTMAGPRGGGWTHGLAQRPGPRLLVADARVEPAVRQVREQIEQHHPDADQEDDPLHHRVVPLIDAVEDEAPQPGQVED